MHFLHIKSLCRHFGKSREEMTALLEGILKCRTFLSCFLFDQDITWPTNPLKRLTLSAAVIVNHLLKDDFNKVKIMARFRLYQYFYFVPLEMGEAEERSALRKIRDWLAERIAMHYRAKLMKTVVWDVSPLTQIEKGFWTGGFHNIGSTALSRIGKGVTLSSGVDLTPSLSSGNAPEIGDGASLWTGAVVFGVKVGRKAVIGANSLVIKDVPDGATVMGVPAKVVFIRPLD
jgi:serine acetyltransferase